MPVLTVNFKNGKKLISITPRLSWNKNFASDTSHSRAFYDKLCQDLTDKLPTGESVSYEIEQSTLDSDFGDVFAYLSGEDVKTGPRCKYCSNLECHEEHPEERVLEIWTNKSEWFPLNQNIFISRRQLFQYHTKHEDHLPNLKRYLTFIVCKTRNIRNEQKWIPKIFPDTSLRPHPFSEYLLRRTAKSPNITCLISRTTTEDKITGNSQYDWGIPRSFFLSSFAWKWNEEPVPIFAWVGNALWNNGNYDWESLRKHLLPTGIKNCFEPLEHLASILKETEIEIWNDPKTGKCVCICKTCKSRGTSIEFIRPQPKNLPGKISTDQKWHDLISNLANWKEVLQTRKWLAENVEQVTIHKLFDSHFPNLQIAEYLQKKLEKTSTRELHEEWHPMFKAVVELHKLMQ